jgi:hypothetical protein
MRGSGLTTPAGVRFDGPGGPVTGTTFGAGGDDTTLSVTIPPNLRAGSHEVRVVLAGAGLRVTNPRELVVLPLIETVAPAVVPTAVASVHELTIDGARLVGTDVRLVVDDVVHVVGANATATQLVHRLGRRLAAGPHAASVVVDGVRSRPVEFAL